MSTGKDADTLPETERSGLFHLGAIALMRGHSRALADFLDTDRPAALILEDDAELASDTPALLKSTDWWPAGAKAVRLEDGGRHPRPLWRPSGRTPSGRELRRLERWCGGSAAYLINREGAQIALEAFANPSHTTDHTLFDLRVSETARRLQTVQIVPAMARQRPDDPSDLARWRDAAVLAGPVRLKYFVVRSLMSLPYKVRLFGLRLTGKVRNRPVRYSDKP